MTIAQRAMLNELLDVESGLTPWEVEFIDGLDRKDRATLAGVGITLTGKQASTLGRIHADRVVRGHVHIETDDDGMDGDVPDPTEDQ